MKWEDCSFVLIYKHKKFRSNEEIIDQSSCKLVSGNGSDYEYGNCNKEKCIFIKILNLLESKGE